MAKAASSDHHHRRRDEHPGTVGRVLNDARERSGDPLAATIPAHVTLLGPTEIDPARFDDVCAHLATVAAAHDAVPDPPARAPARSGR